MSKPKYAGQAMAPRNGKKNKKKKAPSLRKRTKAALARFERWEEQFANYGSPCPLGMRLCQMSIGTY